ncbi:MAG: type II toxin-antitoxin system RelE/ParE family toxin [Spirochaetaceae bacterium]|jgi:hypothetical protein|nr:type II toxin-antitoxin system RelE/ParE family toxin [Spirochaetaceae bacterium]
MRAFKNTWFNRFAEKEAIQNSELLAMVNRIEAGHAEANLGGGVFKERVARPGAGKSGGYRVILFFKSGDRAFFVYGFTKSARGNISRKELRAYKEAAKDYLRMTDEQINERIARGQLIEIGGGHEKTI